MPQADRLGGMLGFADSSRWRSRVVQTDSNQPDSNRPVSIQRYSIRRHEWPAVILAFVYFFCVLAAYYVIRPVRDQLSAAVGSTALPIFYGATFAVTLALTPLFGALVARFPRRRFVPLVYFFFVAGMLAFIPLFQMQDAIGARVLGAVFFVWVSVFNLFVVAVFWSFMADLFDVAQANRLFPIIALGGPLGAIAGPAMTRALVFAVGVAGLLAVSATLLGVAIACIAGLSRWSRLHPVAGDEHRDERIIGGSILAGAVQTLRSPLLRRFALLMLLGDAVGTVVYALLADYSHVTYQTAEARIDFAAGIDLCANLLQVVLQLLVTRELMVRFGSVSALVLDGALKALMLGGLILIGGPWIAAIAVVTRASAYGVFKPAADSLYTRVDAEMRYKSKNFIDTAVWRFGDVVITSSFNLLRGIGMTVPGFAALTMLAAAASGFVGWRLTRVPELRADTAAAELDEQG
jgi:ATP:ADP antiporter, AAA family